VEGSVESRPQRLCRPRCTLADWPFFYETDTSIQDISLKKKVCRVPFLCTSVILLTSCRFVVIAALLVAIDYS
jgi:hypothetical protein